LEPWIITSREFLVKAYPKGNSDHTIEFLQYLQAQSPGQRLVVIWDGASYHRSQQMQQYLEQVNADKVESDWQLYCLRFAPNAPEQNPVEDIWLQAKTYVRQRYYQCPSFKSLKQLFMQFLDGRVFDFPKLHSYG
jgi:transposase